MMEIIFARGGEANAKPLLLITKRCIVTSVPGNEYSVESYGLLFMCAIMNVQNSVINESFVCLFIA